LFATFGTVVSLLAGMAVAAAEVDAEVDDDVHNADMAESSPHITIPT
jgi:hypothetical protein